MMSNTPRRSKRKMKDEENLLNGDSVKVNGGNNDDSAVVVDIQKEKLGDDIKEDKKNHTPKKKIDSVSEQKEKVPENKTLHETTVTDAKISIKTHENTDNKATSKIELGTTNIGDAVEIGKGQKRFLDDSPKVISNGNVDYEEMTDDDMIPRKAAKISEPKASTSGANELQDTPVQSAGDNSRRRFCLIM